MLGRHLSRRNTLAAKAAAVVAMLGATGVAVAVDRSGGEAIDALPTGKTDPVEVASGRTDSGLRYLLSARGSDNGLCLQVDLDAGAMVTETCGAGVPNARSLAIAGFEANELGERIVYGPVTNRAREVVVAMEGGGTRTVRAHRNAFGSVGAYVAAFPDRAKGSEVTVTARDEAGDLLARQQVTLTGNAGLPTP